ncbi:FAD-dependent oxidoreductase [Pedobacter yulinensis]|uniref:FAD-dependent oxidoreductase n=1 Tax=Pedobacter yulinensis TaxID=2126353 RepID=A0A2T3HMA1_9SPHI|nr:NAD(P)/FAD-dependent oxidoreductase [Pedobacter yulinensis]PST83582.1 FAD-dependent oxidoreductase [Pedobacter yulinensis]
MKDRYDAVVVGAGPNGLAAAIRLQQQGLSVLLLEGRDTTGGGMRSAALTLPGYVHDICSAVHPLALASPFLSSLPLADHGLRFVFPEVAAAHPLDDGSAALLLRRPDDTAAALGIDKNSYLNLVSSTMRDWSKISDAILGPLRMPEYPAALMRFGIKAFPSALCTGKRFKTPQARALWAGMAAHAIQPLGNLATSAIGLVLLALGHLHGWPVPVGGSQAIADALTSYFISIGGVVQCDTFISSLEELPETRIIVLDVAPRQLVRIAGGRLADLDKIRLGRYRYGMGVFKIDWALTEPIPFSHAAVRRAGTVHLGGTLEEIARSEKKSAAGHIVDKPFVLLAQQSIADPSRAPEGKHTAWAYCHVPNGSHADQTSAIEAQVERFAPGFKDLILARHTFTAAAMEAYNPNYVGGDINCGVQDLGQLFTRPIIRLNPYRTSAKGVYLCSSATPPGGGVHGMCGFHAAETAIKDFF